MLKKYLSLVVATAGVALVALADLPSGYTQLEWIESDGRQWIDTGVQARSGLKVTADMKLLSTDPKQALFGGSNYGGSSAATYGTNQLAIVTRNASEAWGIFRLYYKKAYSSNHTKQITGINNLSKNINERATWQISDGVFYYNGTKIDGATGQTFNTGSTGLSGNIYILWMGIIGGTGASSVNRTAAMLYGFTIQVKSNSTYLRQFVPARRDSDGAVGMFDTVESVFYQSPGEVPFRAGPTVSKVFSFDTPAASVGYRSEMTVSGYAGGETAQAGFPVLVRISPSRITGFSYASCLAGGSDVYFATDDEGLNRLACEIDTWNTTGESLAWVKLPQVSGTDTKFYMFWGGGAAAVRPPAKEVWSEYVAVWHMNACDPVTGVPDATGHGYNATNAYYASASSLNVSTAIDSPFGGSALNLSYGLVAPNYDEFMRLLVNQLPESSTISCWFKKCGSVPVGGWDTVIYKWGSAYSSDGSSATSGTYRWGYVFELCGTTSPETDFAFYFASGKDGSATSLKTYDHDSFVDNWTQVATVSQGATVKSYVNGTNALSTTVSSIANAFGRSSAPLRFGCAARPIDIEEVRIARVPRSDAWMKAEYDSMKNANFVVAGNAEPLQISVTVAGSPMQYADNTVFYGTDTDVSIGTPKTYTAPAAYGFDASNRVDCAGWTLYSTDPTEGFVLARTSENPLAGEDATTCIITPTGNDALTWLWIEKRLMDVAPSVEGQGTVLGGGWCTNDVDITLTAVPAEGYYFLCWSGATEGVEDIYSTNITVSVDMPKVIRAEFRPATDCVFECNESGTVSFSDPAYWLNGNVPASDGSSVVVMRRPPEGVDVTVTASTALDIAALDMCYGSGSGSLTLELGCGLATNRVAGDVVLRDGATLTHTCHSVDAESKTYALNLEVGGDVTIEEGAAIDVTAKGYYYLKGPMPSDGTGYMGAGYGGTSQGGYSSGTYAISPRKCFGSIRRPDEPGSGGGYSGSYGYGGGAVHLMATNGTLTVNGKIAANGGDVTNSSPAGGSVWIECGTLAGSGSIDAYAGRATSYSHGSGGRIAVRQYIANDISAYLGLIRAGRNPVLSDNYNGYHSVGSIYIENANDAEDRGELIAEGYGLISNYSGMACRLDDAIVDIGVPFGKVSVRNYARLEIPAGVTLKVEKGISVTGSGDFHTAASGGAVEIMPGEDGTFSVEGLVKAYSIYCTNSPGATISFAAGAELRNLENGDIELRGTEEKPLALVPATANGTWNMNIVGPYATQASFEHVALSNSIATAVSPTARYSVNLGGNDNWAFLSGDVPEGTLFTWNGAFDTRWNNPANWDVGIAPRNGDSLKIPSGLANYPVFDGANHYMCSVTNEAGASITLNGVDLFVSNSLYSAGTIVDGGNRIVAFGDGDTVFDIASGAIGNVYVEKTGGKLTLPSGFAADKFYCVTPDAIQLVFGAGEEFEFAQCNIESRGAVPHVLGSTATGQAWALSLTDNQRVRNVTVSDSDASGGAEVKVTAAFATDAGNNTNWSFGSERNIVEWIAGSGSWATAANWSTGEVPGENDDVYIAPTSTTATVTVGAAVNVRSLTIGGTDANVTLSSAYPVSISGDLVLWSGATATLSSKNTPNTVGGNVWMKSGSTMNHAANAKTFAYRLYMTVAGDMTIDSGASIYLTYCGFEPKYGPVDNTKNNADENHGGSHGSAMSWNGTFMPCNDSIFEPVLPGSGGARQGAGAVYLDVVGDLTVNGAIDARSHRTTGDKASYSPGAGGSILVKVGTLKGTGLLTAATATRRSVSGARKAGAGRIAIYQRTGTDWTPSASLTITTQNNDNDNTHGGTIYKELPGDGHRGGTIYIQGRQYELANYGVGYFQFPMAADGDPRRAYKNATLVISDLANIFFITNETFTGESATLKVKDIIFTSSAPKINFYGAKILVMTTAHKDGAGWTGGDYASRSSKFTNRGTRGGIEWYKPCMIIHVR